LLGLVQQSKGRIKNDFFVFFPDFTSANLWSTLGESTATDSLAELQAHVISLQYPPVQQLFAFIIESSIHGEE
jgi:hypothetical protein